VAWAELPLPPRGRTVSRRFVRFAGAGLSALALLLQGCYESLPLQQGPPPAAVTVQLVLNDKGRVEVANELGSAVAKVEGTVVSQDAQSVTIAVSRVLQLNGTTSTWSGEHVTIAKEATDGYQVRRVNQTRTVVLVAAITVAAVSILVTMGLNVGRGASDNPPVTGNPGSQTH
jgi:hypothetical protein